MPIVISTNSYETASAQSEPSFLVELCGDCWSLPALLWHLERWLADEGKQLETGKYVADIGFGPRADASGGGGTLSVSAMETLASVGIEVWFSEYPN